jgi:hypothetical protein
LWPDNREYLSRVLAEVPDEDATKIVQGNLLSALRI